LVSPLTDQEKKFKKGQIANTSKEKGDIPTEPECIKKVRGYFKQPKIKNLKI
jgi:hypothetical protein